MRKVSVLVLFLSILVFGGPWETYDDQPYGYPNSGYYKQHQQSCEVARRVCEASCESMRESCWRKDIYVDPDCEMDYSSCMLRCLNVCY